MAVADPTMDVRTAAQPFQILVLAAIMSLMQPEHKRAVIEHTTDTLAVVKENVATGQAVLVDVRGPLEWADGHIEGAIFLPVDALGRNVDRAMLQRILPQDKILYTFCAHGVRSRMAAKTLQEQGYPVRALGPGCDVLIEAGFAKGNDDSPALQTAIKNEIARQQNGR